MLRPVQSHSAKASVQY